MGDLSDNFSRIEFTCRCGCGMDTVDAQLITILQQCSDDFAKKYNTNVRITITGPNRCDKHNKIIGGSVLSQHLLCKAADIKLSMKVEEEWDTIRMQELYDYFDHKYPNTLGIGIYSSWVHVDVRTQRARW